MSPAVAIWAAIGSGLGAAALTGLFTWLAGARERRLAAIVAERQGREGAYLALLQATTGLLLFGQGLSTTMRARSGVSEGVDVAFRYRKPLDPIELNDRFVSVVQPVLDAQLLVWTHGTQEAIEQADAVVLAANSHLLAVTEMGASVARLRLRAWIPTPEQSQVVEDWMKIVSRARADFVHHIRKELGHAPVVLTIDKMEAAAS